MRGKKGGLIVITANYPFGRGEEFLETEMPYLCNEFSRVIVIPLSRNIGSLQTRELPSNAEVIRPEWTLRDLSNVGLFVRFATKHPIVVGRTLASSLRLFPYLRRMLQEAEFELKVAVLFEKILPDLRDLVTPGYSWTIYSYWFHLQCGVATMIKREFGYPLISRGHGGDIFADRSPTGYLPCRRYLMKHVDALESVSYQGAEYLRSVFSIYADKISVARLGVVAASNPRNGRQAPARIVSCSYVVPGKRIPLLIEAIAILQDQGHEVSWTHIGGGAESALAEIEDLCESKLRPGSFSILGHLSNVALRDWYATNSATVFVSASKHEGVPVSIMEALAQGLPVIATDVGGTSELIAPDLGMYPGLLSANPTPNEIADLIENVIGLSPKEYQRACAASVAHWRHSWNAEMNYKQFARFLASFDS